MSKRWYALLLACTVGIVGTITYAVRADDCNNLVAIQVPCPNNIPESPTTCENQTAADCLFYLIALDQPTGGCATPGCLDIDDTPYNCVAAPILPFAQFGCTLFGTCIVVNGNCKVDQQGYQTTYTTPVWYLQTPCVVDTNMGSQ